MGGWISFVIILFSLLQPSASLKVGGFSYETLNATYAAQFKILEDASINGGALQLTPDTLNGAFDHTNKSGRIMYLKPFRFWLPDDHNNGGIVASFNSYFLINIYRKSDWIPGEGMAFLIAPDLSIPDQSFGKWLGLTNAATDGNQSNQIVAIEFDTVKQDYDPDDNHIGLNINSVRSNKTESLSKHNITLSPNLVDGIKYSVWVDYNGTSKLMEVYMVVEGADKPAKPVLTQTINLKDYVKEESYFGFAGSTGKPQIELNCVLQWNLTIDVLHKKSDLMGLKIGLGVGVPVAASLILFGVLLYLKKRRRRRSADREASNLYLGKLRWLPGMPREFKFKDLNKATNNFHESMKLGEGGFGTVYKGILHDKDQKTTTQIAVKKFSRDNIKGKDDFLAELTIIHRLRHKHLVRLVGWCYEKGKVLLVYDFMPNGSVDKHLYEASEQNTLNWERRHKILAGVASSLHYLHNEYDQKVLHRDLKASNILLDSDYNARLGDFGLARALDNERNSYTEQGLAGVAGTMGYVAPECFHTGKATPESDVFSFGVVVLEVVCGKSPVTKIPHHEHLYSLADWVWMLHREGNIQETVDERLNNDYVVDEAKRLLLLGLACLHPIDSERPQTQAICQIIAGTMPVPNVPPFKPVFTWPSMAPTYSTTNSATFSSSTTTTNSTRSNLAFSS